MTGCKDDLTFCLCRFTIAESPSGGRLAMKVHKRYAIEFSAAMVCYVIVLVGSIRLLGTYGETAWRYPLALPPILQALGALIAFVRFFRALDELEQRMQLEGFAFAFGASALVTFSYGFLEGAGFP